MKLSSLPESVLQLAELIGLPAALKIVDSYAGTRLYVPFEMRHDHPLVLLIGRELADKMARHYGGEQYLDIPRCVEAARHARDEAIAADFVAGASYRALANQYHLTMRGVAKILARMRVDVNDRQADLF